MINVTRLNDESIVVNALMIEFVESTPDTVISLISGRRLMVKESLSEVQVKAMEYHRLVGLSARPLTVAELSRDNELKQ